MPGVLFPHGGPVTPQGDAVPEVVGVVRGGVRYAVCARGVSQCHACGAAHSRCQQRPVAAMDGCPRCFARLALTKGLARRCRLTIPSSRQPPASRCLRPLSNVRRPRCSAPNFRCGSFLPVDRPLSGRDSRPGTGQTLRRVAARAAEQRLRAAQARWFGMGRLSLLRMAPRTCVDASLANVSGSDRPPGIA